MTLPPKKSGFYVADSGSVLWFGKKAGDKLSCWHTPFKPDPHTAFELQPCEAPSSWGPVTHALHLREVKKLKDIQPTREQAIKAAFDCSASAFISRPLLEVPRSIMRQFKAGDEVRIGNLENCIVLAESSDFPGQYAVEHDGLKRRHSDDSDGARTIGAWPWFDILPKNIETKEIKCSGFAELARKLKQTSVGAGWLARLVLSRQLETDMAYQRDYVWTLADKKKLIRSIVEGRPIGAIVIKTGKGFAMDQLVDGKQRLDALVEYISGQFEVDGAYYHELPSRQRYLFEDYQVSVYQVHEATSQAEVLDIFLSLNDSGVPQSEEHLEKVRALLAQEKETGAPS